MKKLTAVILISAFLILLCGCSAKEAIASDKQEYIVASLGFDNQNGKIKMLIEAIVVNTDDLEEDKESLVISGVGQTVEGAFSEIISKITQPLSLGHNAVTVIGSRITAVQLEEIFRFCKENRQLNIAAMLVTTENAEKLLSRKAVSSVAVGYDIMSMLEVTEEEKGTVFKNRFYEAVALKEKPLEIFWMPNIGLENEEMCLNGLAVFKQNRMVKILKNDKLAAFCLVTDSLSKGEFVLENKKISLKFSKITYGFEFEGKLIIKLNIRLKAQGDIRLLKSEAERLLTPEDIFGFGNIIAQKELKLWEKIENRYDDYYANADIRVNIYE